MVRLLALALATIFLAARTHVLGQNCNCPPGWCCSQWGYCGTTEPYCGGGCQEGPCYDKQQPPPPPGTNCNCPPGLCCSQWGFCGTGDSYCGDGCQDGPCTPPSPSTPQPPSPPGTTCNCASNMCCSRWGYCGLGEDYCGQGCQAGPCYELPPPNNGSVADYVTPDFFNGILNQSGVNCEGRGFYSLDVFLEAIKSYPQFGTLGTIDDSEREVAAFFAHVTHETGHLCYINEIDGQSKDYCDPSNTQYPCVPGKSYHGRGPLQLSWNYNYGPAGESVGFDGLNDPDIVAREPVISFEAALWFWKEFCQGLMFRQGFGSTIRAINGGLECDGANPATVTARVNYYTQYCSQLGVDPGSNLRC